MPGRRTDVALAAAAVAVGGGLFLAGRVTAPAHAHSGDWVAGNAAGYADGLATGRALQVGDSVPKDSHKVAVDAFNSGYRAGEADAFGSYDGGWRLDFPYLVVLGKGVGAAPYRFVSREDLAPGTTYRLCADGKTICHS
jgi:hypothetical protein